MKITEMYSINWEEERWILLNVDSGYLYGGKYSQPMFRNLGYVYYYIKVISNIKKNKEKTFSLMKVL